MASGRHSRATGTVSPLVVAAGWCPRAMHRCWPEHEKEPEEDPQASVAYPEPRQWISCWQSPLVPCRAWRAGHLLQPKTLGEKGGGEVPQNHDSRSAG